MVTRLDGTTTKDEVYQAVMRELGNGHSVAQEAVVSVRTTYRGMQTALLKLPAQAARKLLEKQTMRVNWSAVGNMATSRKNVPRRPTDLNVASSAAKKATRRRHVQRHVAISVKRQAITRQTTNLEPKSAQYTRRHTNNCFKNGIEDNTNQPESLRGSTRPTDPDGAKREGGCGYRS